jgi:hypothetical protein
MATLQISRQGSALIARSRLEMSRLDRESLIEFAPETEALDESVNEAPAPRPARPAPAPVGAPRTDPFGIEQTELIMKVAQNYRDWDLVSVRQHQENDKREGWLVRTDEVEDPTMVIRGGRAMRIVVNSAGDLKITRPKQPPKPAGFRQWLRRIPFSR